MKKLLLVAGLLLAVGGGCVSLGKLGGPKTVAGDWYLAFDLPASWIMVDEYESPEALVVKPDQTVDGKDHIVFLQTTNKAIVSDGKTPDALVPADTYVTSGYTQIRVTRLDSHRVIPSDAIDMGDGFSKSQDDDNTFYLKTETDKYEFDIV